MTFDIVVRNVDRNFSNVEVSKLFRGFLIRWTKGFCASGVEGMDVVKMLRKACKKRSDIDIDVVAILNDTVGTLMACAFKENSCQMGVIVGTGTNACYMEKLKNVEKIKGEWEKDGLPDEMIIDIEWGGFGDNGCLSSIYTDYDREIDVKSLNPTRQLIFVLAFESHPDFHFLYTSSLKAMWVQIVHQEAPKVGLDMIPSYVRSIPNGTEVGDFLALDLGGTNFRVLLIRLKGHDAEMTGKVYEIPQSVQRGTGEAKTGFLALSSSRLPTNLSSRSIAFRFFILISFDLPYMGLELFPLSILDLTPRNGSILKLFYKRFDRTDHCASANHNRKLAATISLNGSKFSQVLPLRACSYCTLLVSTFSSAYYLE
ncbi:hypothetical protein Y032_0261g536 [Ancylostoma ceylanicum]|uniref:Phosphotransferase n=2 Tax=Ancylostoma ceylanicum TaxID=53326 RepID=A0A016SAW1_9BILA|nr:hypothetical protein Y032_0261g536 [Ancylostoma ceylanicum]